MVAFSHLPYIKTKGILYILDAFLLYERFGVVEMLNYVEYLNMPAKVGIILAAVFLVMNIIGESLEFKGKVVPEFVKIRKYFARKKK